MIPYNAPWYELLLSGGLIIETESGEFGVKTGLIPKQHRGWVGFYNSKARVRKKVVERHGIDPENLNLGMLVGVGYLDDSRKLTPAEQYQWYLRANKTDDATIIKEAGDYLTDPNSTEEKVGWLKGMLYSFAGHHLVIAGPMPVGHFYRPDTLKRFSRPVPIQISFGSCDRNKAGHNTGYSPSASRSESHALSFENNALYGHFYLCGELTHALYLISSSAPSAKFYHCVVRETKRRVYKQHKENLLCESQNTNPPNRRICIRLSSNFLYLCCVIYEEVLSQAKQEKFCGRRATQDTPFLLRLFRKAIWWTWRGVW